MTWCGWQALEQYSEAIKLDPEDGVLYSNRSATNAELGRWFECLDDATICLKLRPDWFKVPLSFYPSHLRKHTQHKKELGWAGAKDGQKHKMGTITYTVHAPHSVKREVDVLRAAKKKE